MVVGLTGGIVSSAACRVFETCSQGSREGRTTTGVRFVNIVITGDSFVEGVGGSSGGWAQMLADRTKELAVSIFGIGGQTSQDLMKRIAGEIGSETAVVIISIGVNDSRIRPSLRRNEVPIDQFEDNVEKAICAVLEHGASCLVVGLKTVD